jgi:peptide/nickel transport system ATP-binding protein
VPVQRLTLRAEETYCPEKDREVHMPLLEVRNLKAYYRVGAGSVRAVDGVSFEVERSKTLGLVGESGCGKTTLAFALLRLLPPNGRIVDGEIIFDGQDLLCLSDDELRSFRWRRMSMIFQSAMNSLNPVIRVGDMLSEALRAHERVSKEEARHRTAELFQMVGLGVGSLNSYPHELSGGMKQRAVIAMSLICKPELVIADEPTTALDVVVQDQILRRLKALAQELDISLIVVSHDLAVIAEVCDSVAVMYAGQIVEYGNIVAIFKQPRHPYTIGLMSSFPSLVGPRTKLTSVPGEPPDLLNPPSGCRFEPRCPLAEGICRDEEPLTVEVANGHLSKCHFASDEKVASLRLGQVG